MLTNRNIIKALVLSILAAITATAIHIFSATRIQTYSHDIDWDMVNKMKYKDALEYVKSNTVYKTGFNVIKEYAKEPAFWPQMLTGFLNQASGYFVSFLILLFWVGRNNAT